MSKSKKIIVIIAVISILCSMFIIPVSAQVGTVYTISMEKPPANEMCGYAEVLCRHKTNGNYLPMVTFWSVVANNHNDNTQDSPPIVNLYMSTSKIELSCICNTQYSSDEHWPILSWAFVYGGDGSYVKYGKASDYSSDNECWVNIWAPDGYEIVGVKYYGNAFFGSCDIPNYSSTNNTFNFLYSDSAVLYSTINALMQAQINSDTSIKQNADKNAQQIQQNQNDNTDRVIENQNQLQQNEKDEAQNSGQGSVDDISGAIEDKSAGFISSLGNLIQTMSYTGTECAWKFPAIKLPAIAGVMPEMTLSEEQPIDFAYWVEKIPGQILLLIRSLLTIALIVYCFKELYSTISYVLTLKGGGNGE